LKSFSVIRVEKSPKRQKAINISVIMAISLFESIWFTNLLRTDC